MKTIYAFYGTGKSTLTTKDPSRYYDDDKFVPESTTITTQKIRLTNRTAQETTSIPYAYDLIVLPKQLDQHLTRLKDKRQFFDQYPGLIQAEYREMQNYAKKNHIPIIYIEPPYYLTQIVETKNF